MSSLVPAPEVLVEDIYDEFTAHISSSVILQGNRLIFLSQIIMEEVFSGNDKDF